MEREKLVEIWFALRIWEFEVQYGEYVCVICNLCVSMVEIFNLPLGLSLVEQVTGASNRKTVPYSNSTFPYVRTRCC
jgi:hypothetical protein